MVIFRNDEACKKLITRLTKLGCTPQGCAGMLGNNYAESGFILNNVQNCFNKKYGITDTEYTRQVDEGTYKHPATGKSFAKDSVGYGWAQWTSAGRKEGLYNMAKVCGKSIADVDVQFDWLITELTEKYKSTLEVLKDPAKSVYDCAVRVMIYYEGPANQTDANKQKRADYAQEIYNHFFAEVSETKDDKEETKMIYSRNDIVSKMKEWIGAKKGSATHKQILAIYNNHTPLARGYKMTVNDPWCAATVSAAAIACGYTEIIPTECSCGKMIKLLQNMGIWQENDSYVPQAGDIIFFDWSDTGKGDDTTGHDHVGIVEYCQDGVIHTIEGNYNNQVKRRTLKVNGKYIRGFGVPKYTSDAVVTPTSTSNTITYTVKKGDNLTKIAKQYGVTVDDILMLNPSITNASKISVGQKIAISSSNTYVVQKGDTLSKIAKAHGTTVLKLVVLNGIANANKISVGQTIRIK